MIHLKVLKMSKYRIEEIRETLNSGEVISTFYIYRVYLLFFRKYERRYLGHGGWGIDFYDKKENAEKRVKQLINNEQEIVAQKTKKKEIIIHKL
jgi:hypothetical protein